MGLFDFLKRKKDKISARGAEDPKISRIDYLLNIKHKMLEEPVETFGDINFLQLVEKQLDDGQLDLATWNISNQVEDCFELANLYWGQGDLPRAETYLRLTLERHRRLLRACSEHDLPVPAHGIECAKCAACLLGGEGDDFTRPVTFEAGDEPALINMLLDRCLDSRDFDMGAWQSGMDAWTRDRQPKYRLEEFSVYVKALTGGYGSTEEMLGAHERMFVGRAKRNPDAGMLAGYHDDNKLIIDYIFAAILKRIGWEGTYRHSWPNTDVVGSVAHTTRHPDRYAGVIAAQQAEPASDTGIIEDEQASRRFIDIRLRDQKDFDGEPLDATRPARERGKVSGALAKLGWTNDPPTLELMRAYRLDRILNGCTHLFLCDAVGGAPIGLAAWTKLLSDDFGLHPDFIAIAGSEEKSDYLDPQGAWYVYWKKDRRIYAVERDEWDQPEIATGSARMGLNLWPSYSSFVAWWISQHLRGQS